MSTTVGIAFFVLYKRKQHFAWEPFAESFNSLHVLIDAEPDKQLVIGLFADVARFGAPFLDGVFNYLALLGKWFGVVCFKQVVQPYRCEFDTFFVVVELLGYAVGIHIYSVILRQFDSVVGERVVFARLVAYNHLVGLI